MFCPKCGKEIPDQAAFCSKCGASLAGRTSGAVLKKSESATELASAVKERFTRAAGAMPKKDHKNKAGDPGKRKILLIAAAVVVVVVLILVIKLPFSDTPGQSSLMGAGQEDVSAASSAPTEQGALGDTSGVAVGQGKLGGTPGESTTDSEELVELGKDGKRSLKGESKEYKENYNYVFDHQSEIIAMYYQAANDQRQEIANSFKGSLSAVRDMVAAVDPKIFDMIALDAAVDNADSFLGMHLIYSGVNAYFSDSELGRSLRDISESLILSAALDSYGDGENAIRKDELTLYASSTNYALMQTRGTLDEILRQIDVDSGYQSAVAALDWYDGELLELLGTNIEQDLDVMWNGNGDQEAVQMKWDSFHGRLAAIEDCRRGWNDSRNGWINQLLQDIGLDKDISTFTVADSAKRIYALFDRAGKQLYCFAAQDLMDLTMLDDGSILYREGPENDANLIKRDLQGNVLTSYLNVDISGYNTISTSSSDRINSYFRMAACGNVLRRRTESDFERGDYQVIELVRPDGSAETVREVSRVENALPYSLLDNEYSGLGKPQYGGWASGEISGLQPSSDVFAIGCYALGGGYEQLVIDMKTGETYSESDYISRFGNAADKDTDAANLNERYFINSRTSAVYDKTNTSTPVANLSDGGGVRRMFYSEENDQYWVISQTGYYYALDSKFHRIVEPSKLPGDLWDFCPFGLILYQDSDTFGLYDGKLNLLRTFPNSGVIGFMSGNVNILTGEPLELELTA